MRFPILLCTAFLLTGCAATDVPQTKRYTISSGAMQPKLKAGEEFTARVVAPGTYRPTPGDVVVFRSPDSWGGGTEVKRVVAVEGFVIACCVVDGRVTLDGLPLDEPYLGENSPIDLEPNPAQCGPRRFSPVTVEPGHVFVMGDSRGVSVDSRCRGTVPVDRVVAVVR